MALVPLNLFVTHDGRSSAPACDMPLQVRRCLLQARTEHQRQRVLRRHRQGGVTALGAAGRRHRGAAVGAGSVLAACGRNEQPVATPTSSAAPAEPPPGMNFTAVAPNSEDAVVAADGYEQAVVISWGDPVLPNAPQFDVKAADRRRAARPIRVQQRLRRPAAPSRAREPGFRCCAPAPTVRANLWSAGHRPGGGGVHPLRSR